MKKAIVLCSGGLDSVVTAHYVKKKRNYDNVIILFFDYDQRSLKSERSAAKKCALVLKAQFVELKLKEIKKISASLINILGKEKRLKRKDLKDTKKESDKWYVPARNLIFLSYALALAEKSYIQKKEISDIFVGFKNEGKDAFPDQSKSFLRNINLIAKENCKMRFKILAPLIDKDKEDIIVLGEKLNVNLGETWSCYIGEAKQCGGCLACMLRKEGFYWANLKDPTNYLR